MNFQFESTSKIEISASAFRQNLTYLRNEFGSGTEISAVVKGNAYGHSIPVFVPLAESEGIRHFSVFSAEEAWNVKKNLTHDSDIMIMGSIPDESLSWVIESGIEFYVFELERLELALKTADRMNLKARIHLEFETGMNRTGFDILELESIREMLNRFPNAYEIEGICTHFAGAESSANFVRVRRQLKKFKQVVRLSTKNGIHAKKLHAACSAAALTFPDTQMDMVRIGIALYGYWPTPETYMHHRLRSGADAIEHIQADPLKRVLSWKSRVMSVKSVQPGEFVGYGTSYLAGIPTKIAAVPVGYAYGFTRSLSNLGRVIVGGQRTSVIGVVNMNMMLVDITETPHVKRGDEVVLIGEQNGHEITVASFSEMTRHINYETLVRLPADIPRILLEK